MSGSGAPQAEALDGTGLSVAVVAASWHAEVMAGLIDSAQAAILATGAEPTLFRVPGAFELALAAQAAASKGFDAVVALGVVIRGGTPHFEYVCRAAAEGLTRVALDAGIPVGFGLLTCDDEDQARDRAGLPGSSQDKGREAAEAALGMALTLRDIPRPRPGQAAGF